MSRFLTCSLTRSRTRGGSVLTLVVLDLLCHEIAVAPNDELFVRLLYEIRTRMSAYDRWDGKRRHLTVDP